jgi:hypothetical protein
VSRVGERTIPTERLPLVGELVPAFADGGSRVVSATGSSYSTVKNWGARFRTSHLSTEDKERSGGPTQVTISENMDAIHSMILDDWRISAKMLAETLAIFRERVGYTVRETLDMWKLSAKWVPKYLEPVQKRDRVLASQANLEPFWWDPVVLLTVS